MGPLDQTELRLRAVRLRPVLIYLDIVVPSEERPEKPPGNGISVPMIERLVFGLIVGGCPNMQVCEAGRVRLAFDLVPAVIVSRPRCDLTQFAADQKVLRDQQSFIHARDCMKVRLSACSSRKGAANARTLVGESNNSKGPNDVVVPAVRPFLHRKEIVLLLVVEQGFGAWALISGGVFHTREAEALELNRVVLCCVRWP